MSAENVDKPKSKLAWLPEVLFRIAACVVILVLGVVVMLTLTKQRKPPVEAEIRERAITVEAKRATQVDVPVIMEGTGQVRARDVVSIAPEIPGRVTYIHPRLEMGEVVPEGEVLFRIDPRDYKARADEAQASITLWESTVARLQKQLEIDRERLTTLERSAELAKTEYERVKRLFENDNVGTQSGVDQAERAWNTSSDQAHQLSQQISLYPTRIQEANASLASMQAMSGLAEVNVSRTEITAPFNARIKEVEVEEGQYVSPGVNVLTLANDSLLEISVGLNSEKARRWLKFGDVSGNVPASAKAWFSGLEPAPVEIRWVDGEAVWQGTLDRVEEFDPASRTLRVVVRVTGENAFSEGANIPLVDGMFCTVRIPGKTAKDVVQLPAYAVSFPRPGWETYTVYVAREDEQTGAHRLATVPVTESHFAGQHVYIAEGIEAGDLVITTRLVTPLENSLLEVNTIESEDAA